MTVSRQQCSGGSNWHIEMGGVNQLNVGHSVAPGKIIEKNFKILRCLFSVKNLKLLIGQKFLPSATLF